MGVKNVWNIFINLQSIIDWQKWVATIIVLKSGGLLDKLTKLFPKRGSGNLINKKLRFITSELRYFKIAMEYLC